MNALPNLTDHILLKSSSQPDFYDRSVSAKGQGGPRLSLGNALINVHSQEFVVVDGKKFRMTRSPRASLMTNGFDGSCASDSQDPLKKALDNANAIISRQNDQILKQVKQIESLTRQLNLEHINGEDGIRRMTGSMSSDTTHDGWQSTQSSRSGSALAARRRAEAIESGQKLSDLTEMDSPPTSNTSIKLDNNNGIKKRPTITIKTSDGDSTAVTTDERDGNYEVPHCLLESLQYDDKRHNQQKGVAPDRSPALSDMSLSPSPNQIVIAVTPTKDGATGAKPPKGLAARLAMGSQDRRKLASGGRRKLISSPMNGSTPTNGLSPARHNNDKDSDCLSDAGSHLSHAPFQWKTLGSGGGSDDVHLFIAHDNPQVGSTVATRLRTEGSMHVMIESKDSSGQICFLLASIVYSGPIENVEGVDLENPRGSQFIVCSKMTAIKADMKSLPTRIRGDILEVDFEYALSKGKHDVSSKKLIALFLSNCTARVEVILDPSHTNMWYPYFEGTRKMAPQFRSQGVGYIRLGDEMSNYGSAFLSLDAGLTYMDGGATSIVADKNYELSPSMIRTFPGGLMQHSDEVKEAGELSFSSRSAASSQQLNLTPTSEQKKAQERRRSRLTSSSFDTGNSPNEDGRSPQVLMSSTSAPCSFRRSNSYSLCKELEEVKEALQLLGDPDFKWTERVESLRRLHTVMMNISGHGGHSNDLPSALLIEILSALTQCVTKQKNPHVLRSAVCCIRVVGAFASNSPTCNVSWKSLLLETIHLLRSVTKPVYEEAKDTLIGLQMGSAGTPKWTLSMNQLNLMLPDIIAGPRGKGSGAASNSNKVVQWLDNMICNEIDNYVDFLCRKNEMFSNSSNNSSNNDSNNEMKLCEKADIGTIFQKCYQLLLHREEVTRDAAVAMTGSLLIYDICQTTYRNGNVSLKSTNGWNSICSLNTALCAPKDAVTSIRCDLSSKKEKDISPVRASSTSPEGLFLASLSAASNKILSDLSKENHRIYERVILAATQLLNLKVVESKNCREKGKTSSKETKLTFSDKNCDDSNSSNGNLDEDILSNSNGSGIAFRVEKDGRRISGPGSLTPPGGRSRKDLGNNNHNDLIDNSSRASNVIARSFSFDGQRNDSDETKLNSVGMKIQKEKLASDWFELRLILQEIPRSEAVWTSLTQVRKTFLIRNFEFIYSFIYLFIYFDFIILYFVITFFLIFVLFSAILFLQYCLCLFFLPTLLFHFDRCCGQRRLFSLIYKMQLQVLV